MSPPLSPGRKYLLIGEVILSEAFIVDGSDRNVERDHENKKARIKILNLYQQ